MKKEDYKKLAERGIHLHKCAKCKHSYWIERFNMGLACRLLNDLVQTSGSCAKYEPDESWN